MSYNPLHQDSIHWQSIHQYYLLGLSGLCFVQGVHCLVYCIREFTTPSLLTENSFILEVVFSYAKLRELPFSFDVCPWCTCTAAVTLRANPSLRSKPWLIRIVCSPNCSAEQCQYQIMNWILFETTIARTQMKDVWKDPSNCSHVSMNWNTWLTLATKVATS